MGLGKIKQLMNETFMLPSSDAGGSTDTCCDLPCCCEFEPELGRTESTTYGGSATLPVQSNKKHEEIILFCIGRCITN